MINSSVQKVEKEAQMLTRVIIKICHEAIEKTF